MAKVGILFALLFVGGFAFPSSKDDGPDFDEDLSILFDHTVVDAQGRIVGGTRAPEGAYPWMVAMTTGLISRSFLCGGSILNNRRVLTAAHCIAAAMSGNNINNSLRVTVGTNRWNSGGSTHSLQGARNHPQYAPNTLLNDIGILLVASNIVMNNRVRAIPMAWDFVGGNVPCRVAGWGNIRQGGPLSQDLLELRTNTVDGQRCVQEVQRVGNQINFRFRAVNPNIEICAFIGVNRGACNGDSGSALVRNSNNQQIGIVSWGLPCARGAPDMYVRVSAFRSFITSV